MATSDLNDEIDLREIWRALWSNRLLIVGVTLISVAVAIAIALQLPNRYTAQVVLAPAADDDGTASMISSRIGGLASLAGLNPRAAMMDKTSLTLEILKSRAFVANFIRSHDYVAPLFAGRRWDITSKKWQFDEEIYDEATNTFVRKVKPPKKPEPSDWELYKVFIRNLTVEPDTKTGIVRVSFTSPSPVAAQEWVTRLVADLNSHMRQRDIDDANKSISYLQIQLQKTSVTDMQKIFYELIEQQTKKIMLAEVRDEYVFKTIDPATVPEEKSSPKRLMIVLAAVLAGGFIGVVIALIRHNLKKSPN